MTKHGSPTGIRGIGTSLPEQFVPLDRLPLVSPPETLAGFGFTGAYVADDTASMAKTAAEQALRDAEVVPADIDVLLWASALPAGHHYESSSPAGNVLDRFCYTGSWLQDELGLDRASVCGVAQQGCVGMFSALRQAHALLAAEPELKHVLCVGADTFPRQACREILYNVISDAACAVVVSREQVRERWLGYHQLSKGYYWDVPVKQGEILAAYFPSARIAIQSAVSSAGMAAHEIDLVIPTGVNASSWPILMRLCGIPEEKLYQPQHRFGHTIAADTFLLLQEARERGCLQPGMRVLLFAYGFGSSWCALVVEVMGEEVSQ